MQNLPGNGVCLSYEAALRVPLNAQKERMPRQVHCLDSTLFIAGNHPQVLAWLLNDLVVIAVNPAAVTGDSMQHRFPLHANLVGGIPMPGDILNKCAPQSNIQQLHTSANAENRQFPLHYQPKKQQFRRVPPVCHPSAEGFFFPPVAGRIDILTAAENHTLAQLQHLCHLFFRQFRQQQRDSAHGRYRFGILRAHIIPRQFRVILHGYSDHRFHMFLPYFNFFR